MPGVLMGKQITQAEHSETREPEECVTHAFSCDTCIVTSHTVQTLWINCTHTHAIGLYRENAIATESEARDPFGGNVYYVTMQITFPIPEFARKERNLHYDVVHITTKWVSRLVLDHAIAAIQTSR